MDGIFVPVAIARRRDLDSGEKLLLALIEFRMGASGKCWWSHQRLGADVGMTKSMVQRTAARLVEKGALRARLDDTRRVLIYERGFPQSFPQKPGGDPDLGRSTYAGESIDSPGESQKRNSSSEKKQEDEEQRSLDFGTESLEALGVAVGQVKKPVRRELAGCGCGFRGRGCWADADGRLVAVEACPRCHRTAQRIRVAK